MRSQTSTEYLIITAVVIIIAVIVIGVLGGIPSIGSSKSENIKDFSLETELIAVKAYVSSSTNTTFWIQNNVNKRVTIEGLWVNQKNCAADVGVFPRILNIGEEYKIICYNIVLLESTPRVNIRYEDSKTSSEFVTGENTNYRGTTSIDCWQDIPDSEGKQPICTCNDLNKTRLNLTGNFSLQNNIDFLESHCTQYREGEGWDPIGDCTGGCYYGGDDNAYVGYFNGYDFIIDNLLINRPAEFNVGLFGNAYTSTSVFGRITRLGLTNINIQGSDTVGGLLGFGRSAIVNNSYATGIVSGSQRTGGLVARGWYGTIIENSYSIVTVTATNNAGGLIGSFDGFNNNISNVFVRGSVSGANVVGGLGGAVGGDISHAHSSAVITCTGIFCGGAIGVFGSATLTNVSWVNYTSDSATGCGGRFEDALGVSVSGCTP